MWIKRENVLINDYWQWHFLLPEGVNVYNSIFVHIGFLCDGHATCPGHIPPPTQCEIGCTLVFCADM